MFYTCGHCLKKDCKSECLKGEMTVEEREKWVEQASQDAGIYADFLNAHDALREGAEETTFNLEERKMLVRAVFIKLAFETW